MYGILDSILLITTTAIVGWSLIYIGLHLVAIIFGRVKFRSKITDLSDKQSEGVSIIKPLAGYNSTLKDNLESFFQVDYPKFELLLCVEELKDGPCLPIINELMSKYPRVDVKIFEGGENVGSNPKINNMMPGYRNAQYPILWFSDSGVCTSPDTLTEMMSHICNPKVAIVNQLPFVGQVTNFAGYLDKVYFGSYHGRMYLLCNLFSVNCLNGMSWLVSKYSLEDAGGLQAFGDYLAEDYFIGKAIMDRGWKIVLSSRTVTQNRGVGSTAQYRARLIRWTKLRSCILPLLGVLEPFTQCFFIAGISALSAYYLLKLNIALFFISYVAIWFLADVVLIFIISNGRLGSLWLVFLAWLYRESTTYWCLLSGVMSREVIWGGKKYKLLLWGKAIRVTEGIYQTV